MLQHHPGGGDVVGRADVVVDLRQLLRHVRQLVLEMIVCRVNAIFINFIIGTLTNSC